MIRPILTVGLFLTPFILYVAFLFATRSSIMEPKAWAPRRIVELVIASLALIVVFLLVVSLLGLVRFSGSPPGSTYVPAHIDDGGHFVPGSTR